MNSNNFTVYLVRHAQSANNANPESLRIPDPPLTKLGAQQANALAVAVKKLEPTHLFSSPFLRTLQTTAPLAESLKLTPAVRADLYEQGGCYSGYRIDERTPEPGLGRSDIKRLHPNWNIDPAIGDSGWNKLTGYESIDQARQRAKQVSRWLGDNPWPSDARLMLVIHADFKIRILETILNDLQIESRLDSVVNTAWTTLRCSDGRWELDTYNAYPHLDPHMVTS